MADKYLNYTGLSYYHNRIKTEFADAQDLADLSDRVDDIVAEGGEPNVIETVKVNNVALVPDANKAVNVDLSGYAETSDLPTDLSDLTNTGNDPYATESYVDQNGGKIDVIKVNGTTQTITNKAVDITVPTSLTQLANDGATDATKYATEAVVDTKIASAVAGVYTYKGSVATYNDLPASGQTTGDVYDVQATGMNYAWNGSAWDALGNYVDTSLYWAKSELVAITTAEIDTIVGA